MQLSKPREPLYSVRDIASLTSLTVRQVEYRLKKLGINHVATTERISTICLKKSKLYNKQALHKISTFLHPTP